MLILLLCCSLSPVLLLAQEAGGMLSAVGHVTVNGNPVTNPTAVFPGDKIQTGADSSANIMAKGTTVQMGAHSSVTWESQGFLFQDGSVTLTGQAPWQIHIGAKTVSLGAEATQVEVTQRENVALIKLLKGSATLNEGGQTTALKVDFTVARPSAPATTSAPVTAVQRSSHAGIIVVAVGGAAAAGIGLALRGGGSKTPVSPSVP
jgi:hypothetical protein